MSEVSSLRDLIFSSEMRYKFAFPLLTSGTLVLELGWSRCSIDFIKPVSFLLTLRR